MRAGRNRIEANSLSRNIFGSNGARHARHCGEDSGSHRVASTGGRQQRENRKTGGAFRSTISAGKNPQGAREFPIPRCRTAATRNCIRTVINGYAFTVFASVQRACKFHKNGIDGTRVVPAYTCGRQKQAIESWQRSETA